MTAARVLFLTALAWAALAGTASAATTVVTPGALGSWQPSTVDGDSNDNQTASVSFVAGPATPPLGAGSVRLAVGAEGADAAQIRNSAYSGVSPTSLTALSYSTYTSGGASDQAPYIILSIDLDNDGSADDQWFFEPAYQSAAFFASNPQPAVSQGTWQTWDARNGGWYSINGLASSGPANPTSLATLVAADSDARIVNTTNGLGGLRLVTGFGTGTWDDHVGHVDRVRVATASDDTTFDFEAGTDTGNDGDGDGIGDEIDNCPADTNPNQANHDGDSQGDACDADDDNDNVSDAADNCQFASNPGQQDLDGDGAGTACDADELPRSKEQCKDNGWMNYGTAFKNQGACVNFVTAGATRGPAG